MYNFETKFVIDIAFIKKLNNTFCKIIETNLKI